MNTTKIITKLSQGRSENARTILVQFLQLANGHATIVCILFSSHLLMNKTVTDNKYSPNTTINLNEH